MGKPNPVIGRTLQSYSTNAANPPEYLNMMGTYHNKLRGRTFANLYREYQKYKAQKEKYKEKNPGATAEEVTQKFPFGRSQEAGADFISRIEEAISGIEPDFEKIVQEYNLDPSEIDMVNLQMDNFLKEKKLNLLKATPQSIKILQNLREKLIDSMNQQELSPEKRAENAIFQERVKNEISKFSIALQERKNQKREIKHYGPLALELERIEKAHERKPIEYASPALKAQINDLLKIEHERQPGEREAEQMLLSKFDQKAAAEYDNAYQQAVIDRLYKDAKHHLKHEIMPQLHGKYAHLGQLVSGPKNKEQREITRKIMKDVGSKAAELRMANYAQSARLHAADKASALNYLDILQQRLSGRSQRAMNAAAIAQQLREKEYAAEKENNDIAYQNALKHIPHFQYKEFLDMLSQHGGAGARSQSVSTPVVQAHRQQTLPPAQRGQLHGPAALQQEQDPLVSGAQGAYKGFRLAREGQNMLMDLFK